MAIATVRIIVLGLFFLAFLALIISIFRREMDNVVRSLFFVLILGGLFLYFQQSKIGASDLD